MAGQTVAEYVTVCSKLPFALILRTFDMVDFDEPTPSGLRTIKRAMQVGPEIRIEGCATPFGIPKDLRGGYALTSNVPKDFFDRWLSENKEHDAVKNQLIFASERRETAERMAQDRSQTKSGLEPLMQDGDKRLSRRVKPDDGKNV